MSFPPGVTVKDYGVGRFDGISQSEAWRRARALQDHHPDRSCPRRRAQVARGFATRPSGYIDGSGRRMLASGLPRSPVGSNGRVFAIISS